MPEAPSPPICPKCASTQTARLKRQGFLQRLIYPYFRLYPWKCSTCQTLFMLKNRGKLKRRRRTTGEVHLPPVR